MLSWILVLLGTARASLASLQYSTSRNSGDSDISSEGEFRWAQARFELTQSLTSASSGIQFSRWGGNSTEAVQRADSTEPAPAGLLIEVDHYWFC